MQTQTNDGFDGVRDLYQALTDRGVSQKDAVGFLLLAAYTYREKRKKEDANA